MITTRTSIFIQHQGDIKASTENHVSVVYKKSKVMRLQLSHILLFYPDFPTPVGLALPWERNFGRPSPTRRRWTTTLLAAICIEQSLKIEKKKKKKRSIKQYVKNFSLTAQSVCIDLIIYVSLSSFMHFLGERRLLPLILTPFLPAIKWLFDLMHLYSFHACLFLCFITPHILVISYLQDESLIYDQIPDQIISYM